MLTAHANTSATEFLAQLRTFVIAMGLSPTVVDCVDGLVGADELEEKHTAELEEVQEKYTQRGRESMKKEILRGVEKYFNDRPSPLSEELKTALAQIIEEV